ncbi:prepilin-type N-terminal cleavage/methylation domain-containing protein [Candidatus Parcubacteria bacterium]|nr:MAG: prepilin-type N-terminal cleavage/methylation domain-containing protein [Candidatus Parcubacteria bacterium]
MRPVLEWKNRQGRQGFSLVELLVSMGLFSAVVAVAVGGFIGALRNQRQAAALVAAESNLSLAMEQIAREIRTGHYFCDGAHTGPCLPGELIFVSPIGGVDQTVAYRLSNGSIERSVGGTANYEKLTAENVLVEYLEFILLGNQTSDGYPPRVTVTVGVTARNATVSIPPVRIQTTVSARALDT